MLKLMLPVTFPLGGMITEVADGDTMDEGGDEHYLSVAFRDYPGAEGYGISLISRQWFDRALAGSPLSLVRHLASGWDDHHDVLVLRLAAKAEAVSEPGHGFARLFGIGRSDPAAPGTAWFEGNYPDAPTGS